MSELAYSLPEAAKILGIGKTLAYEAAARGEIPTIKIGSRLIVPRAALDDVLSRWSQPHNTQGVPDDTKRRAVGVRGVTD
jgi:excisionase family DNA binding protein